MIVIDMDDICLNDGPAANGMHWMYYLKGKYPRFKINLFCIPGRSTFNWLQMLADHDWINVCMHGWNHDEKESILDTYLEVWEKKYCKVYKGPNWKIDEGEFDLLRKYNFTIATKKYKPTDMNQWCLTDPRAVHGHVWVEADWKRVERRLAEDSDCRFIQEVV